MTILRSSRIRVAVVAILLLVVAGPVSAATSDRGVRARAAVHPSIVITPSTVGPGEAITVSGRNWPARRAVRLYFGQPFGEDTILDPVALVKADSRGRFSKRLWTSAEIPPGSYRIEACRRECEVSATAGFRVLPAPTPAVPPAGR